MYEKPTDLQLTNFIQNLISRPFKDIQPYYPGFSSVFQALKMTNKFQNLFMFSSKVSAAILNCILSKKLTK